MLEKIEKLIKGNDPENIILARELILTKIKKDNVIAVMSLLRTENVTDILEDGDLIDKVQKIFKEEDKRVGARSKVDDINTYTPKDLYELSLNIMKSKDNIKYATAYYINHINGLSEDALNILIDEELMDETFNV